MLASARDAIKLVEIKKKFLIIINFFLISTSFMASLALANKFYYKFYYKFYQVLPVLYILHYKWRLDVHGAEAGAGFWRANGNGA